MKSSFFSGFTRISTSWLQRMHLGIKAGSVAALAVFAILEVEGERPLELIAYNQLFLLRGHTQWSPEVVVIGIDDKSLEQIGSFPWPRDIHANLLQQLTPAEPSAIVFDMVFADQDPADQVLAAAMAKQRKVVLAQGWTAEEKPVAPNATLSKSVLAIGHIHKIEDLDGIARKIETTFKGLPALGIRAAQVHALSFAPSVNADDRTRPDQNWINWPGPSKKLPHYSYLDVVTGLVPSREFTNKVVLVGITATGLDTLVTPFDRDQPTSGVYLHAATVSNVLQQDFLQVPSSHWKWVILAIGGPAFGWGINRYRYRTQILIGGGVAAGWWLISLAALNSGYWIPVMWPIGLVFLTLVASIVGTYKKEEQQLRQQLKTLKNMYSDFSVGTGLGGESAVTRPLSLVQEAADLTAVSTQVSQLIWKDELTQLSNRRRFDQCLEIEWLRAIRGRTEIAILMCDIDFFKGFNDTYGHLEGDLCLKQVAGAINQAVSRPNDLVARYGGEEFIVMLPNTNRTGALHIANAICTAVKSLKIIHKGSQIGGYVTISIGVAVDIPPENSLSQVLVAAADQALYSAKSMGRDRAALYYDTKRYPTAQ